MKEIPGRLLGNRYKIVENIGEGGMARGYRGIETKLNRPGLPLKVLYEQFAADPDFYAALSRKTKSAARLSHPILSTFMVKGKRRRSSLYCHGVCERMYALEILSSVTKAQSGRAVRILIQICDALAHAHSQNVIHRDIKHQHIMLTGRRKG